MIKFVSVISVILSMAAPAFAQTNSNPGILEGCQFNIVCKIKGQIVTGPAAAGCNGGQVETIKQCPRKAPKSH